MTARSGLVLVAALVAAQVAFADEAALLGPLAGTIDAQLRQNWRAGEEDGWFVLRNPNGDNEEQALVITGVGASVLAYTGAYATGVLTCLVLEGSDRRFLRT